MMDLVANAARPVRAFVWSRGGLARSSCSGRRRATSSGSLALDGKTPFSRSSDVRPRRAQSDASRAARRGAAEARPGSLRCAGAWGCPARGGHVPDQESRRARTRNGGSSSATPRRPRGGGRTYSSRSPRVDVLWENMLAIRYPAQRARARCSGSPATRAGRAPRSISRPAASRASSRSSRRRDALVACPERTSNRPRMRVFSRARSRDGRARRVEKQDRTRDPPSATDTRRSNTSPCFRSLSP